MNMPINGYDELGFGYESDASASFLVVTGINAASEYQCSMLGHNAVRCLIPPERMLRDGLTCFYYNITSKVPLSIFLKRKKFSKPEFLKFIFDIASSVSDSYGYLLNSSNFIFRQDQIYICPDTLEPSLIYVPAEKGCESCEALKSFFSELLLQHIQIEGFDNGNIVQRILSAVRSESFNLKNFVTLISELLYGGNCGIAKDTAKPDAAGKQAAGSPGEAVVEAGGNKNIGKPDTGARSGDSEAQEVRPVPVFAILAVLLQFVMALTIYLCRGLIDMAGANHTANYAAVLMIAVAIDVLVFKKILSSGIAGRKAKNGEVREGVQKLKIETHETIKQAAPVPETPKPGSLKAEPPKAGSLKAEPPKPESLKADPSNPGIPKAGTPKNVAPKLEISEPEAAGPEIDEADAYRLSYKTELLGRHAKGVRILKSTGKRAGESDIILDRDDFIIGRLEGHVDHILYNNAVGKLHAELINRNGVSCVKDLNSMNGTFINDNRLESNKEYELRANDKLRLANSEYIFVYSD